MTIDVNQAFAEQRAGQIASIQAWNAAAPERAAQAEVSREQRRADFEAQVAAGSLRSLGNGRYQATGGGWDDGEVFTVQQSPNAAEMVLLLPEHGLAQRDGKTLVYSTAPMWHGLGTVIPEGTNNIDRVLELAGLDYQVHTVPVQYTWNGVLRTHDSTGDGWVTVRSSDGKSLGVVGRLYDNGGVIQNWDGFAFLQHLVDDNTARFESAGELANGKVFVSLRLPNTVRIDVEGINDEIIPFVVAINSHNGNSQFQVVVTPWRPICGNTERFAVRDAHTRWQVRHTRAATGKIKEARRALRLSVEYFDSFAAEEELLARTNLAIANFEVLVDTLFPVDPTAGKSAQTRRDNRMGELTGMFAAESQRLGRTAYAAERALTDWLDHSRPIRLSKAMAVKGAGVVRATQVLDGANDDIKSKAHRQLLPLVRR